MGSTLLLLLLSLSLVVLLPTSNGEAILYAVSRGKAVKDNDLRCNQLASDGRRIEPFCYEGGGLPSVAAKCNVNSKCKGFSMSNYANGYLKTRADGSVQQKEQQYTTFCRFTRPASPGFDVDKDCAMDDDFWTMLLDSEVEGYELNCNKKDADGSPLRDCKIPGNHLSLMQECDENYQCEGFVIPPTANGKFGYLIRSSGTGYLHKTRDAPGSLYFVKSCINPKREVKCAGRKRDDR